MLEIIKKCCFYKYPYSQLTDYKQLLEFNDLLIKDSIFLGLKLALFTIEEPLDTFNEKLKTILNMFYKEYKNKDNLLTEHLKLYKSFELLLPTIEQLEKYSNIIKKDAIIQALEYVVKIVEEVEKKDKILILLKTIQKQF